jgi:hypothetical protein
MIMNHAFIFDYYIIIKEIQLNILILNFSKVNEVVTWTIY